MFGHADSLITEFKSFTTTLHTAWLGSNCLPSPVLNAKWWGAKIKSLPSRSFSIKGQNTSNTHNSEGVEIQGLIYHWWEHNVGAGTLQKDLTVQKLNTQLPRDPEIPLLAICPR